MYRLLLRVLFISLSSLLILSGCGVIIETNFPGCADTGSSKTYRGIGCQRLCKSEYRNCTNGKNADPDNDCQCTAPPIDLGIGGTNTVVPDSIGASCVCYYAGSTDYVNLHLAGTCPSWFDKIGTGQTKTGIGRPIGFGDDSSCTKMCKSGGGNELRGQFQFTTRGKGVCTPEAVLFPGTILGDYVSGGQLAAHSDHGKPAAIARAEARLHRVDFRLAQAGLQTNATPKNAPLFKMQALGLDCRAECTKGSEYCTEFQVDSKNVQGILASISTLPDMGTAKSIDLAQLRSSAFGSGATSCTHNKVAIESNGNVSSDGNQCSEPLFLSLAGVKDFSVSVVVPKSIKARLISAGPLRQLEFSERESMMSLRLTPDALHRLYGGPLRFAATEGDRLTLETQNSCLAIGLKQ